MKPIPFKIIAHELGHSHASQALVRGVAVDSRLVQPDNLFFALPGEKVDGHAFLKDVAKKGAVGAVVKNDYRGETFGLSLLYVPDVLEALQDFARQTLRKNGAKVIAITGSMGKTTAKGFLETVLSPHYKVFASPKSYNSQVTTPLSILLAEGDEDFLILEMGMSEPGNLERLISIAPPDYALLTTICVQHATDFADGLQGISREKATIFAHPNTTCGLLHRDVAHFDGVLHVGACPKKTFSLTDRDVDYFLEVLGQGVRVYERGGASYDLPFPIPMKAHCHNLLAVVALARELEVPWPAIGEAASRLTLPPMRFEQVEKGGILFINDAYNANPDSMVAALENMPKTSGKTIAVLSEMNALGSYADEGHTQVAHAALKHADLLFCLGEGAKIYEKVWKEAGREVHLFESREKLEEALVKKTRPGDAVLLKGARAYALDELLRSFR